MLILHIGLPKTATTFLQHHIFKKALPSAFFHRSSECAVLKIAKVSQKQISRHDADFISAVNWLKSIDTANTAIISCENISSHVSGFWSGRGPSPREVGEKLLELTAAALIPKENLRIIVGTRRQDQMLGSRYSQGASRKSHYSQVGFEDNIKKIIDGNSLLPGHEWLYYDSVCLDLRALFGENNLFFYSVEELDENPVSAIDKLSIFCGFNFAPFLQHAESSNKIRSVNKKSTGVDTWQLGDNGKVLFFPPELKKEVLTHFQVSNANFEDLTGLAI